MNKGRERAGNWRDYPAISSFVGRGSWIRTSDLQYPKLPRYQAALYPDLWVGHVDTRSRRRQQGAAGRIGTVAKALRTANIILMRSDRRSAFGVDLRRHHALGAWPE